MVNCCDEYGNCRQGRDCPVRYAAAAATEIGADDPPAPPSLLSRLLAFVVQRPSDAGQRGHRAHHDV